MNKWKLLVIAIFIIVLFISVFKMKGNNKTTENNKIETAITEEIKLEQTMSDGTKVSTSKKISEIKNLGNIQIKNAQIINRNNATRFIAEATNLGTATISELEFTIILLDKNGNEIDKLDGFLGTLKANSTVEINLASSEYYPNIYDYSIVVK